ncbi:MAG TPA: lactonase family protein [Candidatus Acidoferrales bacterium]|nr:lactonase family protein [Candidatus Acidoferrales bacterium]
MNITACRKLLVVSAVMAFAVAVPAKEFLAYFGTYTNALSRGIYVSRLDADTGKLSVPELAIATPSPCFIAVSPDERFLYTSDSVKSFNGENAGSISAFAIDKTSGRLSLLNRKSSGGVGPCHVSVAADGKVLLAANYGGGSVKSFRLNPDGSIGADGSVIQHHGSGVNTDRQSSAHAHFITPDPGNHFALACDLGMDEVMIYKINAADATLTTNEIPFGTVPPGSGSRHLAFSPDGKFAYVVNEMGCSITTFAWDAKHGGLTALETVDGLPPGEPLKASYTAAEILMHPSGKFIYITLRGHDSVSVFSVAKKTGHLTFVQNVPSSGQVPRGLGIDPTGHWLITGHQKSDNAAVFAIDTKTGKLTPTGQSLTVGSPVDVKFVTVK